MIDKLLREPSDEAFIQLVRYFFVGGAAFAVDFGLLWVLTDGCGVHYLLSAIISFAAGLTVNYVWSVRWVFHDHALNSRIAEFAAFGLIGVLGLGLNEAIIWCGTEIMGLHYLTSKIVSAVVVFLWNFLARKYLLFHGKNQQ